MAFSAKKFSFDGIPSETYNVLISSESGDTTINSSSDVTIYSESIYRKSKPYHYGTSSETVLTFPITIFSPEEEGIDTPVSSRILTWLTGHKEYKKLQLVQCDMDDSYFNVFLTSPQTWRVGNIIRGYKFNVVCDSPFAWTFPKTDTHTYTSEIVDDDVIFNNFSDENDYLYCEMEIKMNSFGGDVTITNGSDDDREFEITGLTASEVMTVDNNREILTSSLDLRRLGNFNKNFLRLVPGRNNLNFYGNIEYITLTYQFAKRMT